MKKRILLVEDLEDYCSLVCALLSEYEVVCAGSSFEALKQVQSSLQRFDLYLVDYYLPHGHGVELCKKLRAVDKATPLLLLASNALLNHQAIELGAQGVIQMRYVAQQLPQRVSELLR